MKKKIPIRDIKFQKSILSLEKSWIESYDLLFLEGKINYARAGQWRPEIYEIQRDLFYSLIMAYTNNHKNVHDKISRMFVKSYHLKFGFVLLPACWDKLAQLVREFLEIKKWSHLKKPKKATEDTTSMKTLIRYLNVTKNSSKIKQILKNYWNEENRKKAFEIANKLKHRWSQHYIGIKTKTSERLRVSENSLSYTFGDKPVDGKVLYEHISILKEANNSFVKCAMEIDKVIDYNQFYTFKNGKKTLCID